MPSLRAVAKEMGISHPYLSRLLNGQRQWTPELYEKYNQLQLGTMVPGIPPKIDTKSEEHLLAKERVAGSSPVFRSICPHALVCN